MRQGRVSGTAKGLALAAVAAVASGLHALKLAYLFALPATLLFAWGSLSQFDLPALYFDAVNPDYLVLRLISTPKNTPVSLVPGNLVLNVFPVLIQIYHGALPFYLGAPFYLLFGTGMFGVRVAHGAFGLAVIAALAFAMRAMKMNPVVAGFALVALALDPGFVYAFRTQFYITVLPLALVFIALGLSVQSERPRPRLAGLFAGLSIYGYFCFLFVAPALFWTALRASPQGRRLRFGAEWLMGAALGVLPYAIGLILIFAYVGGVPGFSAWLHQYFGDLAVAQPMAADERFAYGADMLVRTSEAFGPSLLMTGAVAFVAPAFKATVLLGGPAAAFALSLAPGMRWRAAQMATIGLAGLYALFLVFGPRGWLHHAAPALPLMYLGLAALADQLTARWRSGLVVAAGALPLAALIVVNALDGREVETALEKTGGVGLYSDAITHMGEDAARHKHATRAFLPDWELVIPLEMLTKGKMAVTRSFTPEEARRALCSGRDALLAVRADEKLQIEAWVSATDWPAPETTVWRQRDGAAVAVTARWSAEAKPTAPCK